MKLIFYHRGRCVISFAFVLFNGVILTSTQPCIISRIFYQDASITAEAPSSRDVDRCIQLFCLF